MGHVRQAGRGLILWGALFFLFLSLAPPAARAAEENAASEEVSATGAVVTQRNAFYRRASISRLAARAAATTGRTVDFRVPQSSYRVAGIPAFGLGGATALAPMQVAPLRAGERGLGLYLTGNAAYSKLTNNLAAGQLGYKSNAYGVSLGTDYRFSNSLVGDFSVAYNRDDVSFVNGSSSDSNSVNAIFAGSLTPSDGLWIDGVLSPGWIGVKLRRVTGVGPAIGKPDAPQLWGGLSIGYDLPLASTTISPFARVNGDSTWFPSYTESGPRFATVRASANTFWSVSTVLGLQVAHTFSTEIGVFAPYVRAEYEHDFGNSPNTMVTPIVPPVLVLAPPPTPPILVPVPAILVPGPAIDRNSFNVGGGLATHLADGWSAFADYDGLFGYTRLSRHSVTAGFRKEF